MNFLLPNYGVLSYSLNRTSIRKMDMSIGHVDILDTSISWTTVLDLFHLLDTLALFHLLDRRVLPMSYCGMLACCPVDGPWSWTPFHYVDTTPPVLLWDACPGPLSIMSTYLLWSCSYTLSMDTVW